MTVHNTTLHRFTLGLAACLLLATSATNARAQLGHVAMLQDDPFCGDCCDHDLQFFAPTEFDFDCNPIRKDCGYFFNYDKLNWSADGDKVILGAAGRTSNGSFNPFRVFDDGGQLEPVDPTDPDGEFTLAPGVEVILPAPFLLSTINNATPVGISGWGERYEFGRFDGDAGWMMAILDGPDMDSSRLYGYGFTGQEGTIGGAIPGGIGLPSDVPNNPFNQLLSPFGSVLIVFDDPLNLMRGFIDVVDGLRVDGPPSDPLESDSNGDGILDGDGLDDDIDRDGHFGSSGIEGDDPGEVPDLLGGGLPHDFGDLVDLPTSWRSVRVQSRTHLDGFELMRTHRLSNRHKMAKHQNRDVEFYYGVRYLLLDDTFRVDGAGGVLGDSFWDTNIANNMVGPQIALKWAQQNGRMRYDFSGRFLAAYNIQHFEQEYALGEDLIPGQANHPLYFGPTYGNHRKRQLEFSPVVEIRAQASYSLTSSIAVRLGYNAQFIDSVRRAAQHVKYELPNMGFIDGGRQDIFINGVNLGFDVVY